MIREYIFVYFLSLILLSCVNQTPTLSYQTLTPISATPQRIITPFPTPTLTPSSIPTLTSYEQLLDSPNGNFSARMPINNSFNELPKIQIWNKSGEVLWEIPYQYSWDPDSAPNSYMRIYKWSTDSTKIYFYYSFSYDGWYTLFDGFDLQSVDANTGEISQILTRDCCIAFDFSSDMSKVAYSSNGKIGVLDLVNGLDKNTPVLSDSYEQIGWLSFSPDNNEVLFHTLDNTDLITSILLNTSDMSQRVVLEFWVESIFPSGWTENGNPRYWELNTNTVFELDKEDLTQVIIGTATPYP